MLYKRSFRSYSRDSSSEEKTSSIPVRSLDISSYRKKLKLRTSDFLSNDHPKKLKLENTSVSMNNWKINILWMLNYVVNLHSLTPLWPGWNSKLTEPMQYTQKVWYLPQINQSPTNHSVVAETLRRSLQTAQKAKKNSIGILQKEESPAYDNIFIALGSFYIEMGYYKALGKIISESESGGPFLIQECQVSSYQVIFVTIKLQ